MDFSDIAVPYSDKPFSTPERYGLTPIVSDIDDKSPTHEPGPIVRVREGVRMSYMSYTGAGAGNLWLDAPRAVGLTYQETLVAVAAAKINEAGALYIAQIQDVTGIRKADNPRDYFKTGFHNGLLWRDTLVEAWEKVAHGINAGTSVIQSYTNNHWAAVRENPQSGYDAYDAVAERLDYSPDDSSGNWVKQL